MAYKFAGELRREIGLEGKIQKLNATVLNERNLMLSVMGAFAEFERALIRER